MVTRQLSLAMALGLIAALTACGGGSGGSGGSAPPANQPPVADPGSAQTVNAFQDVLLDGAGSRDPDGIVSTYLWQQLSGPSLTLANADTPQATFPAPEVSAGATLIFSLTVTDNDGDSSTANVSITVNATGVQQRFTLKGTVDTSTSQIRDGDTNAPADPVDSNNSPGSAQRIPNPITVGGYVSQPGTGSEGGLTPLGRDLLKQMQELGIVLDATHLTDEAFWEAFELWDGPVWASHNNCRALVPAQRQFSDEQLKSLIERNAVIGAAFDAWMMYPEWQRGVTQPAAAGPLPRTP